MESESNLIVFSSKRSTVSVSESTVQGSPTSSLDPTADVNYVVMATETDLCSNTIRARSDH